MSSSSCGSGSCSSVGGGALLGLILDQMVSKWFVEFIGRNYLCFTIGKLGNCLYFCLVSWCLVGVGVYDRIFRFRGRLG